MVQTLSQDPSLSYSIPQSLRILQGPTQTTLSYSIHVPQFLHFLQSPKQTTMSNSTTQFLHSSKVLIRLLCLKAYHSSYSSPKVLIRLFCLIAYRSSTFIQCPNQITLSYSIPKVLNSSKVLIRLLCLIVYHSSYSSSKVLIRLLCLTVYHRSYIHPRS